jgi:hypothetical protein
MTNDAACGGDDGGCAAYESSVIGAQRHHCGRSPHHGPA